VDSHQHARYVEELLCRQLLLYDRMNLLRLVLHDIALNWPVLYQFLRESKKWKHFAKTFLRHPSFIVQEID